MRVVALLLVSALTLAGCAGSKNSDGSDASSTGPGETGPSPSTGGAGTQTPVGQPNVTPEGNATTPGVNQTAPPPGSVIELDAGPIHLVTVQPAGPDTVIGRIEAKLSGPAGSVASFWQPLYVAPDEGASLDIDIIVQGTMQAPGADGRFMSLSPSWVTEAPDADPLLGTGTQTLLGPASGEEGDAMNVDLFVSNPRTALADWTYHGFIWAVGGTADWEVSVSLTFRRVIGPTVGPSFITGLTGFANEPFAWDAANPPVVSGDVHGASLEAVSPGWARVIMTTSGAGVGAGDACTTTWPGGETTTSGGQPTSSLTGVALDRAHLDAGTLQFDCSFSGASRARAGHLTVIPLDWSGLPAGTVMTNFT